MRSLFADPVIEIADRKAGIDMRLVLALFVLLRDALVVGIGLRAGPDFADEQQTRAVGRELRRARTGRQRRCAQRLAARAEIEDPYLGDLVVKALGRECDTLGIGTPGDAFLLRLAGSEAPRSGAAVGGHDPHMGLRLILLVARLGHAEHDVATVGTRDRRADARHQPQVFMRDGFLFRGMRGAGDKSKEYKNIPMHAEPSNCSIIALRLARAAR